MDRKSNTAASTHAFGPKLVLLASAAIFTTALTGCQTSSAPQADISVSKAEKALAKGKIDKAITFAEAAVLAAPRDPANRALLGAAYLEAGRYESAATALGDAIELGSTDQRTILSFALAATATGDKEAALATLSEWEGSLDPADAGLAIALAGNPERGVFLLANALRSGANSAKVRQNLAYTYALAGNWRAARVMAAEDVPADKLDMRLSEWAAVARPDDHMRRVAGLLQIAPIQDAGQPQRLALVNFPTQEQMVAEAEAQKPIAAASPAPVAPTESETMAFSRGTDEVETTDPTVASILAATTSAKPAAKAPKPAPKPVTEPVPKPTPTPVVASGPQFVSKPMVQTVPTVAAEARADSTPKRVAPKPAPKRIVAASKDADTHLIQLGSYNSRSEANAGWETLKRKFASLRDRDVVITKAKVKGRIYYRVAAAGFGKSSARTMCSTVKSAGRGCFAYTATNPPKGAIEEGVRIAAR